MSRLHRGRKAMQKRLYELRRGQEPAAQGTRPGPKIRMAIDTERDRASAWLTATTILREVYPYLDGETERELARPRSSIISTTVTTASRSTTSRPSCVRSSPASATTTCPDALRQRVHGLPRRRARLPTSARPNSLAPWGRDRAPGWARLPCPHDPRRDAVVPLARLGAHRSARCSRSSCLFVGYLVKVGRPATRSDSRA